MSQKWEQGSAARDPSYDETASNPFAPIDYAARLRSAGTQSPKQNPSVSYAPGQLYGARRQPPVSSAPPRAAAQAELPSYLQKPQPVFTAPEVPRRRMERQQAPEAPQAYMPAGTPEAGMLYNASLFAHQQTSVMPSSQSVPFSNRTTDDVAALFNPAIAEPPALYTAYPYSSAQAAPADTMEPLEETAPSGQPPWRDPYQPAEPRGDRNLPRRTRAKETAVPERPPVRIGRVIALIAAFAMLVFCFAAGGRLVAMLSRNEAEVQEHLDDYYSQTGQDLRYAAARVDLLPEGQTYEPTVTPYTPAAQVTPSPTPIIAINDPAAISLRRTPEPSGEGLAAPVRTKLSSYPDNPMSNILPAVAALHKENADYVGHLTIDGLLSEKIMQRNNTHYLTHDSLGAPSEAGAVFMDENGTLRPPPENLILRGRCSVNGKTFAPLLQFASGGAGFAAQAMTAHLTTLYEEADYVLFAVIAADGDPASSGAFDYSRYHTFATDEDMLAFVQQARSRSLYPLPVDVTASDRLLTLATVGGDDSLILLYRMVRSGESFR